MTRLARVRDTDACHGEEVYVRYASPLFFCYLRSQLNTSSDESTRERYGNDFKQQFAAHIGKRLDD